MGAFENAVRKLEDVSTDYCDARRVAVHDPGQRHRRRVQRGDRHRVDREVLSRVRLPRVRGRRRQRRLDRRDARAASRGVRARAVPDVRAPRVLDGARALDLPEQGSSQPRRRRQGERREGRLVERGAERRPLSLRLRRRRGHGVRSARAAEGHARGRPRSGADRGRDEPDHDRPRARARSRDAARTSGRSTTARSASTSTSTSSARSSTNRLAWSQLGFMLCSPGGFQIWRRDVLEELGGYSTEFTCEDIELTFRAHERFRREGRDYLIHCLPGQRRGHGEPEHVRQARVAARALAARDQRDRPPLPAHVVQPSLRLRRLRRCAVLPPHGGRVAGDRGDRDRHARRGGRPSGSSNRRRSSSSWRRWPS